MFGELQEYFDVTPTENLTLDDFPTLRHIVNFLAAVPQKEAASAAAPMVTAPVAAIVAETKPRRLSPSRPPLPQHSLPPKCRRTVRTTPACSICGARGTRWAISTGWKKKRKSAAF